MRAGETLVTTTEFGCRGLNARVTAEEFDFPLDDVGESDATVVDVVVPACAAVKLSSGGALGHRECGTDRCLGVVFGDDEQDRDCDVAGVADGAVGGDGQQ